ncbi:helix-turn-helix domain-containing protein [Phytomonospora sp. NPDC050363]|uniref:TetR/AcrR family transcriptional regulator n=1 Tax=Phytomonospora sp. NPDC050363 TaxID=3155642 RepID=UPI0033DD9948
MATRETPAGLRADAAQNRERILTVARELFAERGGDVPMDEIARRAGVGIATLYRRFPTREALIQAGVEHTVDTFAALVARAKKVPDPALAFAEVLERARVLQLEHRGFSEAMCPTGGFEEQKRCMRADMAVVIERAKDAGLLCADFTAEDFLTIVLAHAGVVAAVGRSEGREAMSRRFMAAALAGYGGSGGAVLPPPVDPVSVYGH